MKGKKSARRNRVDELIPGQQYRVLSVHPPWAWAIIFAGKDVENRSWSTPYRGRILIPASSRKYGGASLAEAREFIAECSGLDDDVIPVEFPRSQILGTVEVVDCIDSAKSPWADPDSVHWILRKPTPLTEPITGIDGKLNLWTWTCP
jgi:hypothetical protein